jgi:hypothetical protein
MNEIKKREIEKIKILQIIYKILIKNLQYVFTP